LKTFLDNEDIPYIDLLEDFKVATQKESLYKFRDTHWNDRGNDFAAEIIFNHLVKILKLSH
jgi:hypothetical protein